jgi:hypothetical protein
MQYIIQNSTSDEILNSNSKWGMKNAYTIKVRNLKGRGHFGDLGIHRRN